MAGNWIVPFAGRGETGVFGQNFIWRSGNLFVMDNHRAAAWCWSQCVDISNLHALVHIDRHNDTLQSQLETWLELLPAGIPATIEDYLGLTQDIGFGIDPPVFRWDNYLSIYLALAGEKVGAAYFATHREGDDPNHHNVSQIEPDNLAQRLRSLVVDEANPLILNLDLDYFFGLDETGEKAVRILDDEYFDEVASAIALLDRAGKLSVITVALTATEDLTDGWGPAEELAQRFCSILGRPFLLPPEPLRTEMID